MKRDFLKMEEGPVKKQRKADSEVDSCIASGWVLTKPTLLHNVVTGEWAMFLTDRVAFGIAGKNSATVSVENEAGFSAGLWESMVTQAKNGEVTSFLRIVRVAEMMQEAKAAVETPPN